VSYLDLAKKASEDVRTGGVAPKPVSRPPAGGVVSDSTGSEISESSEVTCRAAPAPAVPRPPRDCPDCGAGAEAHELRCGPCLARWRATPVPWCAAIDCRRPRSGEDQGFCSPEHRAQTEEVWPW
jgi:hypothetical protein